MKMALAYATSLSSLTAMALLRTAGQDILAVDAVLIAVAVSGMVVAPFSLRIN